MSTNRRRTYLTPNDVAELLMVNPVTVRQWAARGLLRAVRTPGGHRRFLLSDVEEFARSRGAEPGARPHARPARVLIVDDDPQFALYLAELISLRDPDISIELAHDGFEAGIKTESFRPHAVVLDVMMPGLDGFQVCRLLRTRCALDHIRIVAVTGCHTPESAELMIAAGANACLPKPIDPETLLRELGLQKEEGSTVPPATAARA
ncbi:MAG TPA: response regulator [Steroidobacteraceae bacterium]|nr:response regulator [Steroidobacteraceae bacterium]